MNVLLVCVISECVVGVCYVWMCCWCVLWVNVLLVCVMGECVVDVCYGWMLCEQDVELYPLVGQQTQHGDVSVETRSTSTLLPGVTCYTIHLHTQVGVTPTSQHSYQVSLARLFTCTLR